ncbi:hypothetical protein QBC44DRAFT_327113 [Cladorrhinum sp. PSN332]|nr:hypothetical protein QBC44DRAFT_327113 [Cladorrhinum sp. PSN332]
MEQSLLKQNRASKQHLESFRDELTNSQEKAQKSLAALKRDLLKATASPSQDILNKVRDKLQLTSTTPSSPDKNHVLEQAQKILDLGQSVINTYQAMQKGANRPDVAETMQEWEENKDQVAKLVEYGKKEGQKLVDKMVVPYPNKRNPPLPQRGMGKAQGGDLAAVMFPKTSRIQDLEQTWGVAARNQLRALVSLVNAIPRVEKEVKVKNAGKG